MLLPIFLDQHMFMFKPIFPDSLFKSANISISSSFVLLIKTMSSANSKLVRYLPSTCRPFLSQSSLLNTSSNARVNNLGDIGSPCRTPLLIGIRLVVTSSSLTVRVAYLYIWKQLKTRRTPLHPQSNGMAERPNRTINQYLSLFVNANQRNWEVDTTISLG